MDRLSKSTIRLKKPRDQFQLPKFQQRGPKKIYSSLSQKNKRNFPYKNQVKSVYRNMKISRGIHNSVSRSSSIYKKSKMRRHKSKSNINIFEEYNTRGSSRNGGLFRKGSKLENLNFRISNDASGPLGRLRNDDYTKKRNNFLSNGSGFLRKSLTKKSHNKKKFGFNNGKFVINTASTDNLLNSPRDEKNRSAFMKTREKKERRKARRNHLIAPKDVTAKSWVVLFSKKNSKIYFFCL